jgi:hypothetical protein
MPLPAPGTSKAVNVEASATPCSCACIGTVKIKKIQEKAMVARTLRELGFGETAFIISPRPKRLDHIGSCGFGRIHPNLSRKRM